MEYLHQLLESSSTPFWSALILGLMTAISPCPLATNITAIGFISKDIVHKRRIFISGLMYTLGRALSYTSLGLILYLGASRFHIAQIFQGWGERLIGILLIIIGVLMLDVVKINFPTFSRITAKIGNKSKGSYWGAFLLGIVFALAFCPYSGALYFGMLIPMTVANVSGLYLPLIFAIATGLPVIMIAWILAYSVASIGNFYQKVKLFETWFRRVVAGLFIIVGFYYLFIFYFK
jgi:cytochrome c-type biogenesis protein